MIGEEIHCYYKRLGVNDWEVIHTAITQDWRYMIDEEIRSYYWM